MAFSPNFHLQTINQSFLKSIVYACLSVIAAFALTKIIQFATPSYLNSRNIYNISIVFILACMFVAGRYGFLAGLIASIISFLMVNYFYIAPYDTFKVTSITEKINLALFLGFTMLAAAYNSYQRARLNLLNIREKHVSDLYALTVKATESTTQTGTLETLESEVTNLLDCPATIHLPNHSPKRNFGTNSDVDLDQLPYPKNISESDKVLFDKCWQMLKPTGNLYRLKTTSEWRFQPLHTPMGKVGVMAIYLNKKFIVTPDWNKLIEGIAVQAASIIQRIALNKEMQEVRISEEREKLRSMLLSSVSHDLKTPLASIIGSLSVYHSMFDRLSDDKKMTLTHNALDEAQRLDSFISNILDITRLESGAIEFKPEYFNVKHMVQRVIKRMQQRLQHHQIDVEVLDNIDIKADKTLTEQILQNLLDNAAKYTNAAEQIKITICEKDNAAHIDIQDSGKGIPDEMHTAIFDKYTRLKREDSQVAGTGLGLAIAKTIMEKQEGSINVQNALHNGKPVGAIFSLCFPTYKLSSEKVAA